MQNAELEAAIIADPEAEGPYVVYGDWLLARGDPRGELIGLQLALETARGARWAQLKRRELELLQVHASALLGPAAQPDPARRYDWRRGFIDRISGDFLAGAALLAHPSLALVRAVADVELAAIRRAAPPLLAELAVAHHALAELLALPALRRLRMAELVSLDVEPASPRIARSGLEALAVDPIDLSPWLDCAFPELRLVRIAWRGDAEHFASHLAFAAATPRAELDLTLDEDTPFDSLGRSPAGAHRIAALRLDYAPASRVRTIRDLVPAVRCLELVGDRSGPALTVDDIAALPEVERLGDLQISRALTDRRVVAAIVSRPYAATIEALAIEIHDRGVFAALCQGAFPRLRRLALEGIDQVSADQLDELAAVVPALEELVVYQHQLPAIAASRLAARIRTLTLRGLGRLSLSRVPSLDRFTQLRRLRLRDLEPLRPDTIDAVAAFDVPIELASTVAELR